MARIRSIKPEAFTSETLVKVSCEARWTFAGLWTYADDEGRGKADPRLIKAAIWPLDDDVTPKHVGGYLDELEAHGLVCRYESAGRMWLHVPNFKEHQHPSKPQASKLPACDKDSHGGFLDCSGNGSGALPVGVVVVDGVGEVVGEVGEEELGASETREDVQELLTHLYDRIEANSDRRPRAGKRERDAARLLVDADKRPLDEAHRLIDWCQQHSFWHAHVLSMQKFRDKYQQMVLQAKARSPDGYKPYQNPTDHSVYDQPLEAS